MMDLRKRQITNQAEKNEDMFEINSNITNKNASSEKMASIRHLKIYAFSWNVNTKQPKLDIKQLIKFDLNNQPDICVFGFQEVNSKPIQRILDYFNYDPWTIELTNFLGNHDYFRLQSTRLVGIILNIYVKKSLITYIRCSNVDWVRLGLWGYWGNKGANIFCLNIGGSNVCFVNSHLSAHEDQDKARILEHMMIFNHRFKMGTKSEEVCNQDYLFFFGDLNFRVENLSIDKVKELIEKKDFETLLKNDQLKRCISEEVCFNFHEADIKFPPTYKFDLKTQNYDYRKKKRMPSWCDRILYKFKNEENKINECKSLEYDSITSLDISDHKPVYGLFEIKIIDTEKLSPLVKFQDISPSEGQNLKIKYFVSKTIVTHSYDWIGLYKPNFKSSDEYLTYVYASRIEELENKNLIMGNEYSAFDGIERSIEFQQEYLEKGEFILGYFSIVSNQIIGISNLFELKIT